MNGNFDRPPWTKQPSSLDPAWLAFPELEIYPYGWHADGELELIELGARVSDWLSWSMMGAAWDSEQSRVQSATMQIWGTVAGRYHDTYPEEQRPLAKLKADYPEWVPQPARAATRANEKRP